MRIRTFQGLHPTATVVERVASLPYDVVSTEEARALVRHNPQSMLRVVRAEIDFPPDTDPYSYKVYAKAVDNFRHLQQEGHLIRESHPCLYLYQQRMGSHVQRGVVTLCHVEDYENNLIKKHENTRQEKEDDRTRLISNLSANPGPVFLTYRDQLTIERLVAGAISTPPLYDFTAEDGIRHTVWRLFHEQSFINAFAEVPCTYVADGHHRSASAARVARERRAGNPYHNGTEEYNWFLCVLFPASQLKILPYNRVVHDLNGLDAAAFLEKIKRVCPVAKETGPHPTEPKEIRIYLAKNWYRLRFNPTSDLNPVAQLDLSVLQKKILKPTLGIEDQRLSSRIEFIGGLRSPELMVKKVNAGEAAVAFSLYPVTVEQLMDIADAGQIMPPKSTWFEPKLRSGLFIHTFEPAVSP